VLSPRENKVKSAKILGSYGADYHINTWLPVSGIRRTQAATIFTYFEAELATFSESLGWLRVLKC